VIAGSFDLKAYCVSGHTGEPLWDYTVGNRVYTVRGIGDVNCDQVADAIVGTQYYGGSGGKVFCLDADGDETGVVPVSDLACAQDGAVVELTWAGGDGEVLGFNVYRAAIAGRETAGALRERLSADGSFTVAEALAARSDPGRGDDFVRLNEELVRETGFTDANVVDGAHYAYMVGAVLADGEEKLEGPIEIVVDLGSGLLSLGLPTPNPSGGSVTLTFSAPPGADAECVVYSPAGQLVRRVAVDLRGMGSVTWDGLNESGSRVAPGVYMVRLCSSEASSFRKVVIVE
jgi:outer membrane protein assembly factor BamB